MSAIDGRRVPWQRRPVSAEPGPFLQGAAIPSPRELPGAPRRGSSPGAQLLLRATKATLVATVLVILFGAVVRITGSGAGCGQHWPTCQGEVAHLPRSVETLIEFTHRVTSGLLGLAVFALAGWAFRVFAPGHPVRRFAVWTVVFILIEALIGMLLVKLALVGTDASLGRAVVMPLHLVNTLLLLGALVLTGYHCLPKGEPVTEASRRASKRVLGAMAAVLVVSVSGAVTALGDTIFPVRAGEGFPALAGGAEANLHFLTEARVFHPVLAVLALFLLLRLLPRAASAGSASARRFANASVFLVVLQGVVGAVNVLLSAPGYMQVVHLLGVCSLWIALVLAWAELREPRRHQGRASGFSLDAGPTLTRTTR